MKTIKEVIVVEGRHDSANLRRYYNAEIIETGGTGISSQLIERLRKIAIKRQIIIFTDPDSSGEYIRRRLSQALPECLHAHLSAKQCRKKNRVGIEFAQAEELEAALGQLINYTEANSSLGITDLYELGLCGNSQAKIRRDKISEKYQLGDCNAKTLLKRLQAAGVSRKELEKAINQ